MKKELTHFYIGESYGGNQDWFRTFMMRIGGCGAETACDTSIYLARELGVEGIYPYDKHMLTRRDYVDFAHKMENYLWPRWGGINKVSIFIDGYRKYLKESGISGLEMEEFSGRRPYEEARDAVRSRIDKGYPIPYLMLNHTQRKYRDYVWHWFLVNGYDERDDGMFIKAVTYSGYQWLDLKELWNTGSPERGGLVLLSSNVN